MLENMLLNYCFDTTVRTNALINFYHGKPGKGHGKGHGILESSKVTNPVLGILSVENNCLETDLLVFFIYSL